MKWFNYHFNLIHDRAIQLKIDNEEEEFYDTKSFTCGYIEIEEAWHKIYQIYTVPTVGSGHAL